MKTPRDPLGKGQPSPRPGPQHLSRQGWARAALMRFLINSELSSNFWQVQCSQGGTSCSTKVSPKTFRKLPFNVNLSTRCCVQTWPPFPHTSTHTGATSPKPPTPSRAPGHRTSRRMCSRSHTRLSESQRVSASSLGGRGAGACWAETRMTSVRVLEGTQRARQGGSCSLPKVTLEATLVG